jgi:hypothetical protein
MLTLSDLQKDLETYIHKQAELREQFANLTGAIQLLTLQIKKLEEQESGKVDSEDEECASEE